MARRRCSPAVVAGLCAATAFTVPSTALALELPGTRMGSGSELLFAFLFGCTAGVSATFASHAAHAMSPAAQASLGASLSAVKVSIQANGTAQGEASVPFTIHFADPEPIDVGETGPNEPLAAEAPHRGRVTLDPAVPISISFSDAEPIGVGESAQFEPVGQVASPHQERPVARRGGFRLRRMGSTGPTAAYSREQLAQVVAESAARAEARATGPAHMRGAATKHVAPQPEAPKPHLTFVEPPEANLAPQAKQDVSNSTGDLLNGLFVVPDNVSAELVEGPVEGGFHAGVGFAPDGVFATVAAAPDEEDLESAAPASTYFSAAAHDGAPRHASAPERPNDTGAREAYRIYDEAFASQVSSEYERVAADYARKKSAKRSAVERLRGVKATLQDRLGTSMMEGIPIISRADGTVADVGTSWWNERMGEQVVGVPDESERVVSIVDEGTQELAKRAALIAARIALLEETGGLGAGLAAAANAGSEEGGTSGFIPVARLSDRARRATGAFAAQAVASANPAAAGFATVREAAASGRLPRVEREGSQASPRFADAPNEAASRQAPSEPLSADPREALWRVALEELAAEPYAGEASQFISEQPVAAARFTESLVSSQVDTAGFTPIQLAEAQTRAGHATSASVPQAAGGFDDLDEPDGLEGTTSFIPFEPVGGHPEVVDTSSYVDYLIEDEFAKSNLAAARERAENGSIRAHLRVMNGGTAGWRAEDDLEGAYGELEWLEAREA